MDIVHYHAAVESWKGDQKAAQAKSATQTTTLEPAAVGVPTVQVNLIHVSPSRSTMVEIQVEDDCNGKLLLLKRDLMMQEKAGLQVLDALMQPLHDGRAHKL